MKISILIALSLAADLVLAAILFRPGQGGAGKVAVGNPSVVDVNNSSSSQKENGVVTAVGKFSWQNLEAADMKEFVAKLRAVNCPEETIKHLVLAELNRRFTKQQNLLFNEMQNQDYWKPWQHKTDPEEQKKNLERSKQMQAMQKEKTALIVELFGVDVEKQRMREEGYDPDNMGWNPNGNLSFLPEAKREAVQKYLEDFQQKEQEFYASVQGSWDADARAKQKKLEQEKMDGLTQLLTPEELREYKLRNSQIAQQISSDLHGVDLTRAQYEALFDIRSQYGDSIYNYGDAGNDADTIKQIEQNKKNMQADIAAALGADKAVELERAQDYQYQQLASLAKHNDLPADTAPKIYDVKQTAENAAAALKASQDFTPEERQAALAQIRAETEASVKAMLGDKLYKRYTSNSGWWLNGIAPPAKK